jgi:hypothetical protein
MYYFPISSPTSSDRFLQLARLEYIIREVSITLLDHDYCGAEVGGGHMGRHLESINIH